MQKQVIYSLFLLTILSSCNNKPLPSIEGIDMNAWREDKNGCLNYRSKSIDILLGQKEKLKSLDQMEIVKLLGRPDRNELYKRNQKFFYYLLEPGVECGVDKQPRRLSIRFNAVELAKEITVE